MLLHASVTDEARASTRVVVRRDESLSPQLPSSRPSFRPSSQDETVSRAFRWTNACDELNDLHDVCLGYGVAHHDLVHEIHYGGGWLLWFQLGEHVALVVRFVRRLSRHESEASAEKVSKHF